MKTKISISAVIMFVLINIFPYEIQASNITDVSNSLGTGQVSTTANTEATSSNTGAAVTATTDTSTASVAINGNAKVEYGYVDVNTWLNVRKDPSTRQSPIGRFYRGEKVTIMGEQNGWYKINYKGREAWVCARYVSKSKIESDSTPEAQSNIDNTTTSTTTTTETPTNGAGSVNGVLKVPKRSQFSSENVVNGTDYRNSWCGPNSFAMVLDYYGIHKSAYECAKMVEYTFKARNGTPISGIVHGAQAAGFTKTVVSSGQSMDWLKAKVAAGKPVIVNVDTKWKGHYIVVVGFDGDNVIVNDPGKGSVSRVQYSMSKESFWSCWSSKGRKAVVLEK
ncbi:MAG TPA: C39 family peptidase [Candidatus Wallbacteria bacterium]|nr:C39 family peptidase [Candidatus Wallbacteria bacterium]